MKQEKLKNCLFALLSGVDSWGVGVARAPPEYGGLEKGQSLISAYQSLASTSGFEKLYTTALV